jgi:hypothetical protein
MLDNRRAPKPKLPAYHRDWFDYVHGIILGFTFLAHLYRVPFINTSSAAWAADEMQFICRVEPAAHD